MAFYQNEKGGYKLGWMLLFFFGVTVIAVIVGSLFIAQRTYSADTRKPTDSPTYTKNVIAMGGRRRKK